jgi:hypothetical protein
LGWVMRTRPGSVGATRLIRDRVRITRCSGSHR